MKKFIVGAFSNACQRNSGQAQHFAATGNSDALKGDKWRVVETPLFERKNDFPPVMYFMIENVK